MAAGAYGEITATSGQYGRRVGTGEDVVISNAGLFTATVSL